MNWNPAQRSAINEEGKNILVSAAAGSGKTAVLTERICRLVKEGTGIDEMLIVTFTNAAAGEMKERIGQAILKAMEEEGADVAWLQAQFDKINMANISTFHSFCYEVVRNYFFLTDLTADFKLCDVVQEALLEREAMDEVLDEFFEKRSTEFLHFLKRFSKPGNERAVVTMIELTNKHVRALPEPEKWLRENVEALRTSQDSLEKKTYADACVLRDITIRFREILLEKKVKVNQLSFDDVQHFALEVLKNPDASGEYREKFKYIFVDEYQDTNGLQEAIVNSVCRENNVFLVGDVKQSIYRFRLAEPDLFINRYRQYRQGDDPLSMKIDLNFNFRSKNPIIELTNRVMKEIMTEESCGLDYDEAAMLREGGAVKEPLEDKPDAELLPRGPVLDLVQISDVKDAMEDAINPEHELEAQLFAIKQVSAHELEAHQICKRIKEILGKTYYDRKDEQWKIIGPGDIVVLMRGVKAASQTFQDAFREEGIPCYAEGGDAYFDTVEISVFTNLLRLISNRRQDIPLLSVLRMPCYDFSAEDLARIRINKRDGIFAEAFFEYAENGGDDGLAEKCRRVINEIDRWRDLAGYIPLRDLLCTVSDETGYYDYVSGLHAGNRRRKNLETLFDIAENFQKSTAQGLNGFIVYLEKLSVDRAEIPSGPAEDEGGNFVRIMTIHKSKGLEFPVVFIADTGRQFNTKVETSNISLDKDEGLGIKYRAADGEYDEKTARQERVTQKIKLDQIAEEMRLLYVAMTRAREKLYITGTAKRDKNGGYLEEINDLPEQRKRFIEWLYPAMQKMLGETFGSEESGGLWSVEINHISEPYEGWSLNGEGGEEAGYNESGQTGASEAGVESPNGGASEDSASLGENTGQKTSDFEYKYIKATTVPVKYTATELTRLAAAKKEEDDRAEVVEPKQITIDDILSPQNEENSAGGKEEDDGVKSKGKHLKTYTGAERGTITHELMQRLDLSRVGSQKETEAQIREFVANGTMTEAEAASVDVYAIDRFFKSSIGKRLLGADRVYREKEFLLWEPCDEEAGSIIQGVTDCFFIEDGEAVVIDYKTDYIPDEGREEAIKKKSDYYRTQLEVYKRAVEESTDYRVKETWLCFLGAGAFSRIH